MTKLKINMIIGIIIIYHRIIIIINLVFREVLRVKMFTLTKYRINILTLSCGLLKNELVKI